MITHQHTMGTRLRVAMAEKGWNARRTADEANLHRKTVNSIARDRIRPNTATLEALAAALEKDVSFFFPSQPPAPQHPTAGAQANADEGSVIHNPTPASPPKSGPDIDPPPSGNDNG